MLRFLCKVHSMENICNLQSSISSLSSSCSSSLLPVPLPSRRETHFWYVLPDEVKSVSLLSRYSELLSSHEKENVCRMHGDQLQKGALLARALVRTTIARYDPSSQSKILEVQEKLPWKTRARGRDLADFSDDMVEWDNEDDWCPPPLHFNLSHTSSMIACAVTLDSSIGVDVEEKERRIKHNVLAFAKRYFSPYELEMLYAISDPEAQHQEFLKLWTLKESYVKAVGRGFSAAPFKTFTIRCKAATRGGFRFAGPNHEESEIIVESLDDTSSLTSNWEFALLELAGSHYASICIEKDRAIGIGGERTPMRLTVRKTIPLVEEECVSGTDLVVPMGGLIQQF